MDPQHRSLLEETLSAWTDGAPSTADISGTLTGGSGRHSSGGWCMWRWHAWAPRWHLHALWLTS